MLVIFDLAIFVVMVIIVAVVMPDERFQNILCIPVGGEERRPAVFRIFDIVEPGVAGTEVEVLRLAGLNDVVVELNEDRRSPLQSDT